MMDDEVRPKVDAEYIVNQIADASPELRDRLINDIADVLWARQRSSALDDAKQHVNSRYLHSGAEVTTDAAGTVVGLTGGKGQFDIVNFIGGSMDIDSATNARQINVHVGGAGADCLFDYLVSTCFATLAGFTEGKVFTSLSGCTFKGYSTVGGAVAQAIIDFPPGQAIVPTVAICGGSYVESGITIGGRMHWLGAGRTRTIIGGNVGATPTATIATVAGAGKLYMAAINMVAALSGPGIQMAGGAELWALDCRFDAPGSNTAATAAVYGPTVQAAFAHYTHCQFPSGYGSSVTGNSSRTHALNCEFTGTAGLDLMADSNIGSCHFNTSAKAISVLGGAGITIHDNYFLNGGTTGISVDVAVITDLDIHDNRFNGYTIGIDTSAVNNQASIGISIMDNDFGGAVGTPIKWGGAGQLMQGKCSGNITTKATMFSGTRPIYMRVWDNWEGGGNPAAGNNFGTNALQGLVSPDLSNPAVLSWPTFYVLFGNTRVTVAAGSFTYAAANTYYVSVASTGVLTANTVGAFPANEYPLAIVTTNFVGTITAIDYYDSVLNMAVAAGGAAAAASEPFVTIGNTAGLSAERALTAGAGISIVDGGANGIVTIAATGTATQEIKQIIIPLGVALTGVTV